MQKIYLDNAATTKVTDEVLTEMLEAYGDTFGNPNSLHSFGRDASALVDKARDRVASLINAKNSEIYFTSGGTESNNWAIIGLALANRAKGNHIITSQIEHPSILEACKNLERLGFEITYLPVDKTGLVDIAGLLHYINHNTINTACCILHNLCIYICKMVYKCYKNIDITYFSVVYLTPVYLRECVAKVSHGVKKQAAHLFLYRNLRC